MTIETRNKLIALGPEKLANVLLDLAGHYDEVDGHDLTIAGNQSGSE